jgi:hypothetical protein
MIAAFHPPATFSVRFVPISVSPAGEKVHAAGEKRYLCDGWCLWDPDGGGPSRPGHQAQWHCPAVTDHRTMHRTHIRN